MSVLLNAFLGVQNLTKNRKIEICLITFGGIIKVVNKRTEHFLNKWLNCGVNFVLLGVACTLLWLFIQMFCIASFHIPTDSMEPDLLAGDVVLVNKLTYGARLFNILDAVEGKQVEIVRLPGMRKVKRNDVVVFNNPCPRRWRKLEIDVMQYYVKRCVALPGDIFRIEDGRYKVAGYDGSLGKVDAQDQFRQMIEHQGLSDSDDIVRAYPGDHFLAWTTVKFGPFYIPCTGDSIPMNIHTYKLYHNVIEWEQKDKLVYRDGQVYLSDKAIEGYRFLNNYYFMAGDKVNNSKDSRYWGLLPEEYIVGKVWRIWKSVDKYTGKTRWERVWKKVR